MCQTRLRTQENRLAQRAALQTPIIVMTGHATSLMKSEALHRGAYGFLAKPFAIAELRNAIALALGKEGVKKLDVKPNRLAR